MDRNEIRESKGRLIQKSWDQQASGRRERDDKGENGVELWKKIVTEVERRQRRLEESAYNEKYRRWRTERMPKYLQEKSKGQKLKCYI